MFAGKHSNLTKILVDVLNVRFFSGLSNVSFRYSCMCNGSLPCCAIWFGIVITDYVYAPRYKVVSNRPPLFSFRMSPVFQRCGPNPAGALVSRVIVFEYKIHLVLTPL